MGLDAYSLISVEDYKAYAGIEAGELEMGGISLYSDDGDPATVAKSGNILTLAKTGGTGTGHSIDLAGGTPVVVTDITNGVCTTAETQGLKVGDLIIFTGNASVNGNTYEITALNNDSDFTIDDLAVNPGAVTATTCILASYDLGKLAVLINNYDGWTANLEGWGAASSTDLKNVSATNCLLVANQVTLIFYDNYSIERMIDRASQIIENFLRRKIKSRPYVHERYSGDGSQYLYVRNYPIIAVAQLCLGSLDVIRVKYTSTTQRNAYVSISSTGVTLTLDGTPGSEITFASFKTLVLLAAEINAKASWEAVVVATTYDGYPSSQLYPQQNIFALDDYAYLLIPDEPASGYEVDGNEGLIYLPGGFPEGFKNVFLSYTGGFSTVAFAIKHGTCRFVSFMDDKRDVDEEMKAERLGDYSYTAADLKNALTLKEFKELQAYQRMLI